MFKFKGQKSGIMNYSCAFLSLGVPEMHNRNGFHKCLDKSQQNEVIMQTLEEPKQPFSGVMLK